MQANTQGLVFRDVSGRVKRLRDSEYHKEKTLAIKLLEQYSEYLDYKSMPMLEHMLSTSAGWNHVD